MANIQPPPLLSPSDIYNVPPDVTTEPSEPAVPPVAPYEAYRQLSNIQYSPPGTYTTEDFQTALPNLSEGRAVSRQIQSVGSFRNTEEIIKEQLREQEEDKKWEQTIREAKRYGKDYDYIHSPFMPAHPERTPMYNYEPDPLYNPPDRASVPPNPEFAALRGGYVPDVTVTKKVGEGTANLIDQTYQVSPKFLSFVKNLPIMTEWTGSGLRGQLGGTIGGQSAIALTPALTGMVQPTLAQARVNFHEALHAWDAREALTNDSGWTSNSPMFKATAVLAGLNPITFEDMIPGRDYFAGLVPGDWAHVYNLPANYPGDWMRAVPVPLRKFYEDIYAPNKKTDIQEPLLKKQQKDFRAGVAAFEKQKAKKK